MNFILIGDGRQVLKYKSKAGPSDDRISHAKVDRRLWSEEREKNWEGMWFGALKVRAYTIKGVKRRSRIVSNIHICELWMPTGADHATFTGENGLINSVGELLSLQT